MSILLRKIEYRFWHKREHCAESEIPADAITGCLRSKGNAISVWEIDSDAPEHMNEIILALSSSFHHLDAFDIVWISKDTLVEEGVKIINTPGIIPISDLVDRHRDLHHLTDKSLTTVASTIWAAISNSKKRRVTKGEQIRLLNEAVDRGRVNIADLNPDVSKHLLKS